MTDTKLAEDLERIANAMAHGSCLWPAGVERDMAALARVTAAIEHLERGAELFRESCEGSESAREWPRLAAWLEADQARRNQ